MKVTYNWLKDFVDINIPAQELADKLTMAGLEVISLKKAGGDFILELEITPNRPDCLSVIGIAREAAAITNKKFRIPNYELPVKKRNILPLKINVQDKRDCPLFSPGIIGAMPR